MKRFATKQPLWHGIWQRHAGFGLYYLTEKFTEYLNLLLLSSVQRSNNQCNIIVTSRLCTELPQSHPPGGMSCSWAAFFLLVATVWALCSVKTGPELHRQKPKSSFKRAQTSAFSPVPGSYLHKELAKPPAALSVATWPFSWVACPWCAGLVEAEGESPARPSCWTRTGWGHLSIAVVPGLSPLRGSARPSCTSSVGWASIKYQSPTGAWGKFICPPVPLTEDHGAWFSFLSSNLLYNTWFVGYNWRPETCWLYLQWITH